MRPAYRDARAVDGLVQRGCDVRRFAQWFLLSIGLCVATATAAEPLTGKPFELALDQRIGRAWGGQDGNTLRDVVRQLMESQRVSILLDRRIDPTQSIELMMPPAPLRDLLAALAHKGEAEISVVGNVVYLGPADSAKKLRTLVELRHQDLLKLTSGAKAGKSPWRNRPTSLTQKKTFVWQDFDRPGDLLQQVASKFQIEIDGLDRIPHDLWAAGSLPQVAAVEALSVLLVQFGSTFEFVSGRAAVRIVPIPERVFIERSYPVLANSPVILDAARKKFADVEIEQAGAKLIVRGTVEQQGEIAVWLRPRNEKTSKPPEKTLRERTFVLIQRKNVSLGDVIKSFTDYGVKIEYAPAQFAEAGISLDQKIDIDKRDISAEKLFRELFEPLGIEVTIDDDTVRLKPKPKSP